MIVLLFLKYLHTRIFVKQIHVVFANAGVSELSLLAEATEEQLDHMWNINVKGTFSRSSNAYSHLHISPHPEKMIQVDFDVTNTGARTGDEVAQVYVGMPPAAGEPPKQLKGFQKLHLNPGETGHASLTLDARVFQ